MEDEELSSSIANRPRSRPSDQVDKGKRNGGMGQTLSDDEFQKTGGAEVRESRAGAQRAFLLDCQKVAISRFWRRGSGWSELHRVGRCGSAWSRRRLDLVDDGRSRPYTLVPERADFPSWPKHISLRYILLFFFFNFSRSRSSVYIHDTPQETCII